MAIDPRDEFDSSVTASSNCDRRTFLNASLLGGAALILAEGDAMATGADGNDLDRLLDGNQAYEGMNPADTQAQRLKDLVTANHILADQGVNDGFGHISVRSLENPKRYFMSRSRAPYLVTANDIMEFDEDSKPLDQRERIMYEERYIHGEIYRARPDVQCVVHSHTPAVIPFAATKVPLQPIIHMAAFLAPVVPLFEIRDVEGEDNHILVTNPRSGLALAKTLAASSAVLMAGHGCTVVGPNVRQAVYRAIYLKMSAEIQQNAISMGTEVRYLSEKEAANFGKRLAYMGTQQPLRPWPVWEARARANREYLLKG